MRDTTECTIDGGWIVHPSGVASTILAYPTRNHEVLPRSMSPGSEDTYVLPDAFPQAAGDYADTAGMRIPLGTVVWVHNRSAVSGTAKIVTSDAAQSWTLLSGCSCSFVLASASSVNVGTWRRAGGNQPSAKGAEQPDGFVFELDLRRSQNNVHVLTEAVSAGYDGTEPGIIRVRVRPNVVIGSDDKDRYSLDIGGDVAIGGVNWGVGTTCYLTIENAVLAGYPGGGGGGGIGGTGAASGIDGEDGGCALRAPIDLVISSTGTIQGGGGGGGGGDGSAGVAGRHGGGGGGGAGANVDLGRYVHGGSAGTTPLWSGRSPTVISPTTLPADEGTLWLPGAGGVGSTVSGSQGGHGGVGGGPAAAGSDGYAVGNLSTVSSGGAAGSAISRASGATITFLPGAGGVVTGATIVE